MFFFNVNNNIKLYLHFNAMKTAKGILQKIEQEDSLSTADESLLRPFASTIVQAKLIRHVDKDVRLLTASCIGEVNPTAKALPFRGIRM